MMNSSMMYSGGMGGGWMLPIIHVSGLLFLVGIIALTIWMTKLDKKSVFKIAMITLAVGVVGMLLIFGLSMATSVRSYSSVKNMNGKQMMNGTDQNQMMEGSEDSEYNNGGTVTPGTQSGGMMQGGTTGMMDNGSQQSY